MKVEKLIEELKKCDPEAIVCAGFYPIWGVEQMASYWDGYIAEVKDKDWIYNLSKDKVVIHLWDEFEFMALFFRKDKEIPTFEEILKHIKNIPTDATGKIKENYVNRFKKEYETYKKVYEKLKTEKDD